MNFAPLSSATQYWTCRYVVQPLWLFGILWLGVSGLSQAANQEIPLVYSAAEVDTPPAAKREIKMRFSRAQRKNRAEITLRFIVNTEGKTEQLTIVKFNDPDLVGLASKAYGDSEYVPATRQGKPVNAWMEVTESAK